MSERDESTFFLNRLAAKRKVSTDSFKGAEEAKEAARKLAEHPALKYFPEAREMVQGHELDHALSDPEVEGRIGVKIITIGITKNNSDFIGMRIIQGEYIPEGRDRTYDEMKAIAYGVEDPSIIDHLSVLINAPDKNGFKPKKKKK